MTKPERAVWAMMHQRCYNTNAGNYVRYGGRGISVCDRWHSFELFLADMGSRPSVNHTLDRRDGSGDYGPHNCRWATWTEQANNRRGNRLLTLGERTMTIAQWAIATGICRKQIGMRLAAGWSVEKALTQPLRQYRRSA